MKKAIISFGLLFIVLNLLSQTFPFDSIPANLKKRADAVIRSEQCQYRIIKPGNAVEKYKMAVTLLNEDSKYFRYQMIPYDNFSRVKSLKGAIYDESGKMVKAFGMVDAYDMSAITGGSFYTDDRMKVLYFPLYKYPYTIEYEYEKEYTSIISYPGWSFQDSPDVSVERSGIQYIVPGKMKLRYYGEQLKNKVDSVINEDVKIYTWQEENLPAIASQQYYAESQDSFPVLYTAPLDFEYGGIKGSMSSWKAFGDWVYTISKDRDVLPAKELAKVSEIAARAKDKRETVKLIYEYVQSKTRYLSVQIGIGGFRPAEASSVAQNGFGDCKALVNYTSALLKAAKINSIYTLVFAGKGKEVNRDFVDNQFNHVILCVPMEKDSVWLDCTSQTLPFNYLSSFSADRNALLITPEGGKMVKTPGFADNENVLCRKGSIYLNIFGTSSGKIINTYSGKNYDISTDLFSKESDEEMKRYLYSVLRFPDFTVSSVSFEENKSDRPTSVFTYSLIVNSFATIGGGRFFFNPAVTKEEYLQNIPTSLKISETQITTDSIAYNIPLGYKVDFLPSKTEAKNEFGEFRYHLEVKGDKVIYQRYLKISKGVIPLEKFDEFRDFINSVAKTDRQKIILSRGA